MAAPMESKSAQKKIEKETKLVLQLCKEREKSLDFEDPFLKKCRDSCTKILENHGKTSDVQQKLKDFSQAVLDLTFYDENNLVNESFPEKDGKHRLQKLLDSMSKPEKLVQEIFKVEKQAKDVLGEDVYECLLWRQGALLYMYCSVSQQRPKPDIGFYKQCLEDGVNYLSRMLDVRTPVLEERRDVTTNDEMVYELLKKGIFSDTHVLAMMYTGELCHWHWSDPAIQEKHSSEFDSRKTGRRLLTRYVELVKGPLKSMGWNCERAEELLKDLDK